MNRVTTRRNVASHRRSWCAWTVGAALCWLFAAGAQATQIYKCTGPDGRTAYQDSPCPADVHETKVNTAEQPLIGAPGGADTRRESAPPRRRGARAGTSPPRRARAKPQASWECRAANGEVFYRHTRCPSSIPGDGVARTGDSGRLSAGHQRGRHDAWSRVQVHGVKLPRTEACRRMGTASAAGRDGHQLDERVATYDRLMGRDPCAGE